MSNSVKTITQYKTTQSKTIVFEEDVTGFKVSKDNETGCVRLSFTDEYEGIDFGIAMNQFDWALLLHHLS